MITRLYDACNENIVLNHWSSYKTPLSGLKISSLWLEVDEFVGSLSFLCRSTVNIQEGILTSNFFNYLKQIHHKSPTTRDRSKWFTQTIKYISKSQWLIRYIGKFWLFHVITYFKLVPKGIFQTCIAQSIEIKLESLTHRNLISSIKMRI